MLVLKRRKGDSVMIGDDIEVIVVGFEGGAVRLGFKCPDDVPILRSELLKNSGKNRGKEACLTKNPEKR